MNYRNESIRILKEIENLRHLKCIYGFVEGMHDDKGAYKPDKGNLRKDG